MGKIKYVLAGLIFGAGALFLFNLKNDQKEVTVNANVVVEQIKAVSKVVVAEGLFSEI